MRTCHACSTSYSAILGNPSPHYSSTRSHFLYFSRAENLTRSAWFDAWDTTDTHPAFPAWSRVFTYSQLREGKLSLSVFRTHRTIYTNTHMQVNIHRMQTCPTQRRDAWKAIKPTLTRYRHSRVSVMRYHDIYDSLLLTVMCTYVREICKNIRNSYRNGQSGNNGSQPARKAISEGCDICWEFYTPISNRATSRR